jgi:endo-1,4-beta-xylanase
MKSHQPNVNKATLSVATSTIVENVITQMAEPKEPQYTEVEAVGTGLYPTLSGTYEAIWDEYEEYPIDIIADGTDTCESSFKFIWTKSYLYIQVKVMDTTNDITGDTYQTQDGIGFFINEDGNKNSVLTVGDSYYYVNRSNVVTGGFGADPDFESVTYELYDDENTNTGYIVEAAIPLVTIKGSKNTSIGFEVLVNDAVDGGLISIKKWASSYLYDFSNFSALGTITFK